MKTFTGKYVNGSFVYSEDVDAIKSQLVSILNTPAGSRFYMPSYGSHLNEYRFSVLNYFTINMIGQEVKEAINMMSGVTLSEISYTVNDNSIIFNIDLMQNSDTIRFSLAITDGVAY